AGLSGAKTASLLDLAAKVDDGTVRLDRVGRLSDDAVIQQLVTVRGIGPWTADMFLIFTLHRLDVWPVGDYGVRVGYSRAYGLSEVPTARELAPLGDRFRPYRTYAAWYCWRVAGTEQPTWGGAAGVPRRRRRRRTAARPARPARRGRPPSVG